MRQAYIKRTDTSDAGTFGQIVTDSGLARVTGELPWHDNQPGISCIPTGIYTVTWRRSPKHGVCYHVENVAGRTDIEIHSANWVGDKAKGYKCQLLGCIAPGMKVGILNGQRAVISSAAALDDLIADLGTDPWQLTITEEFQ